MNKHDEMTAGEQIADMFRAREANTTEALRGQIEILENRIAAAIAAIETIDRYSIEGVYDFGAISKYDYGGDWVHFEDLDAVRDILQGNSPEIPEGSK